MHSSINHRTLTALTTMLQPPVLIYSSGLLARHDSWNVRAPVFPPEGNAPSVWLPSMEVPNFEARPPPL